MKENISNNIHPEAQLIIAIGDNKIRKKISKNIHHQ